MTMESDNRTFFAQLKVESEHLWQNMTFRSNIFGFQIQPGTKWLPGLNELEINAYEKVMGFKFPQIYRDFLTCMNGTDKETVNLYAETGHPYAYSVGFYSYPRDIERVKELIAWIYESFGITEQEVHVRSIPHILPIIKHRFLIVDNCASNPVLSMYGDDVIPYASDLRTFLVYDIFHGASRPPNIPPLEIVKYWLDDQV